MSKEDIIKNQASSVKNIERYVSFLVATARIKGGQAIGNLADAFGIKLVDQIKEVSTNFTKSKYGSMFSDEVVKTIGKVSGMNSKEIREILNGETLSKEKDAKDKKQKEAEDKKQQVIKHEVTLLVKNDGTALDAVTREIGKSPSFTKSFREQIENLYTNNNNVVAN
jgi:DNA-binding transcriptional MerR regulator